MAAVSSEAIPLGLINNVSMLPDVSRPVSETTNAPQNDNNTPQRPVASTGVQADPSPEPQQHPVVQQIASPGSSPDHSVPTCTGVTTKWLGWLQSSYLGNTFGLVATVYLGYQIYINFVTVEIAKWSARNDALGSCIDLLELGLSTPKCNDTIARGVQPLPFIKKRAPVGAQLVLILPGFEVAILVPLLDVVTAAVITLTAGIVSFLWLWPKRHPFRPQISAVRMPVPLGRCMSCGGLCTQCTGRNISIFDPEADGQNSRNSETSTGMGSKFRWSLCSVRTETKQNLRESEYAGLKRLGPSYVSGVDSEWAHNEPSVSEGEAESSPRESTCLPTVAEWDFAPFVAIESKSRTYLQTKSTSVTQISDDKPLEMEAGVSDVVDPRDNENIETVGNGIDHAMPADALTLARLEGDVGMSSYAPAMSGTAVRSLESFVMQEIIRHDITPAATRLSARVTLDLAHKNISALPIEVIRLIKHNVDRLALSRNPRIALPDCFSQCHALTYLNIRWCRLDSIPQAVFQLPSLQILDVSKNRIEIIPEEISNLRTLRFLAIARNRLSRLPFALADMPMLVQLKIDENPIRFPPPHILTPANIHRHATKTDTNGVDMCIRVKGFLSRLSKPRPDEKPDAVDLAELDPAITAGDLPNFCGERGALARRARRAYSTRRGSLTATCSPTEDLTKRWTTGDDTTDFRQGYNYILSDLSLDVLFSGEDDTTLDSQNLEKTVEPARLSSLSPTEDQASFDMALTFRTATAGLQVGNRIRELMRVSLAEVGHAILSEVEGTLNVLETVLSVSQHVGVRLSAREEDLIVKIRHSVGICLSALEKLESKIRTHPRIMKAISEQGAGSPFTTYNFESVRCQMNIHTSIIHDCLAALDV